jgi:predicted phage terminase large subunit-like protein
VVVGTRYNYDDLYGFLIENEIPEIQIIRQAEDPETGELLFPERMTREFLDSMRKKLGSYMYSCQYMNEPVSDEDQVFLPENFRWVLEDGDAPDVNSEPVPDNVYRFLLVDMANTKTDDADYSALVGVAVDERNRIFVEYAEQRRVQSGELVDWIYAMDSQYEYEQIGIEQVGLADLTALVQAQQQMGRRYIPCVSVKTSTKISKHQRIRMMQPEHQRGVIFLRKHQKDLIDQMRRFPAIRKDDLIDALSMFKRVVYAPSVGGKKEKKRERSDVADHESWEAETTDHWAGWTYSPNWEEM